MMNEGATRQSMLKATAITLDSLLERCGSPQQIDYVKMDIEGAERAVLRENTSWASRVRCIKVEVHKQYSVAAALTDVEHLGFRVRRDANHVGAVIGIRD